jgi:group I intron endonuclease
MTSKENLGDIYIVRCNVNDKVYIGQTTCYVKSRDKLRKKGAKSRIDEHFNDAFNENRNSSPKFYNAIRKYSRAGFTWDILETVPLDQLNDREVYWIKEYDSVKKGYNITHGG